MSKIFDLILHPDELKAAIELKYFFKPLSPRDIANEDPTLRRCFELLDHTSRSFAAVIKDLNDELRVPITIFYLVLRGLDTIEDDMELDRTLKLQVLKEFPSVLQTKDWTFDKCSEKENDRVVLLEFDTVLTEYHKLKKAYREIIADITRKMADGMSDYVEASAQKNYEGVKTLKDYDIYCHHVAGIVGEGLTRMAVYAGFGTKTLTTKEGLQESMGQFLQKTNIIRDYREDIDDGRSFWPKEVWSKYTDKLTNFKNPEYEEAGLNCVSELVVYSLQRVTDCLEYLSNITEKSVFPFYSVPQVMSIATLELIFNNPDIFQRNVKLRRGLSAKLMLQARDMEGVYSIFREYSRKIHLRNRSRDPNFMEIEVLCGKIEQFIDRNDPQSIANLTKPPPKYPTVSMPLLVLVAASGLIMTSSLMIGAAYLNGAQFDIFGEQLNLILKQFFGDESPSEAPVHGDL